MTLFSKLLITVMEWVESFLLPWVRSLGRPGNESSGSSLWPPRGSGGEPGGVEEWLPFVFFLHARPSGPFQLSCLFPRLELLEEHPRWFAGRSPSLSGPRVLMLSGVFRCPCAVRVLLWGSNAGKKFKSCDDFHWSL